MKKNLAFIIPVFLLLAGMLIILSEKGLWPFVREHVVAEEVPETEIPHSWGFRTDSLKIDTFQVSRNQNLSDILISRGISLYQIDQLARNSKPVFDVRRIRLGNKYYFLQKNSSLSPDYFIYEENPVDYIVFELNDSLQVYRGTKPIEIKISSCSGIIESSLWNALAAQEVSPILAIEMSDIFAWTIDFFGIQKGDRFKVIYEERFVEGASIGLGKIHAAIFEHMGEPISAFFFKGKEQEGYFDKDGKSLRKAFLKAPLNFSRISSRFSHSRMHPVLKYRRPHLGVDYAAPSGTPVYSIGDGVIVKKAYQGGGGGNYLTIKHNSVYSSQYMHLQGYAKGISPGNRVKQGQLIGYVGMTGLASGPHLDFRIFKNGAPVDPLTVKAPPVEPIHEFNAQLFYSLRDSVSQSLDSISYPDILSLH